MPGVLDVPDPRTARRRGPLRRAAGARRRRASSPGRRRPPRARSPRAPATARASPRTSGSRARAASSASVAEPTRTSSCRSAARSPCSRLPRLQSMQRDAHGYASSRSCGISLPQFVHVPYVPSSMRLQRGIDLGEDLLGVLAERVVDLAAERRRRRLARGGCRSSPRPPRPRRRASRDARRGASRERARRAAAPRGGARGTAPCRCAHRLSFLPSARRARRRRGEPALDQRRPHPGQLDDLLPAAVPRNERHRRARQRERLGEEAQDRFVRAPALGRLGDAHLPRVAVPPDDGGPAARRD